jgi:hypothetical protein
MSLRVAPDPDGHPIRRNQNRGQSITRAIDAEPDGRLVDKTAGVEMAYTEK